MNGQALLCLMTSSISALRLMALNGSSDRFDALRSAADSSTNFFELRLNERVCSSGSGEFLRDLFDTRRLERLLPSSCFFAACLSSYEVSDSSLSSYVLLDRRPLGFSIFLIFNGCSSSLSDFSSLSSSSARDLNFRQGLRLTRLMICS